MLYNALYTVLYIATYTNSNSTIKKVTIAYDRCVVRDDACQRPSPQVCTVINMRERTDPKPPYGANRWGPFGVPLMPAPRSGQGRGWAGAGQRVPWPQRLSCGAGRRREGEGVMELKPSKVGHEVACAWELFQKGNPDAEIKPWFPLPHSQQREPRAVRSCWPPPGPARLMGTKRSPSSPLPSPPPHLGSLVLASSGPSVPLPSTAAGPAHLASPSSHPPPPGSQPLWGWVGALRPPPTARCPSHRTTTVHMTLTNTTPPHTRQPHGHEPQRQLRNGTCPGVGGNAWGHHTARQGEASCGERGRSGTRLGLVSYCWCGFLSVMIVSP